MRSVFHAESIKLKRTFAKSLLWLAPFVTMALCILLGSGSYLQGATYNWWYTMLLPGALSLFCALVLRKDARLGYRGLLGLPVEPDRLWWGMLLVCAAFLVGSCLWVFLLTSLGGLVFGQTIPYLRCLAASLLLTLCFLWQVPLCLLLAERLGLFAAVLLGLGANLFLGLWAADRWFWWAVPFAIPSRLMCPVLGVLPNGLPVPAGSPLSDPGVLLPGALLSLLLFLLLALLTARLFQRREVR